MRKRKVSDSRYRELFIFFSFGVVFGNGRNRIERVNEFLQFAVDFNKLKKIFAEFMENDPDIPEYIREKSSFAIRVSYFTGGIVNAYKQRLTGELDCSLNDIPMEIASVIAESDLS